MKRIAIVVISLFAVAVAAFFYFSPRDFSFYEDSPAYRAIPLDAPLFFEISSARAIPFSNPLLKEVREAGFLQVFFSLAEKFDSIIANTPDIPSGLRSDKLLVAFKHEGRDEMTPLFIVPVEGTSKRKAWSLFFGTYYSEDEYQMNERSYDQNKVTDISNNQNLSVFTFAFADGLLLASPKSVLVEQALRQMNSTSLMDISGFSKVNRTASRQTMAAVYINHRFFPGFISRWLSNEPVGRTNEFGETQFLRYGREVNAFSDYAGWTELDIKLNDDGVRMSGISSAFDSVNNYLSIFLKQQPLRFQADKLLPANTAYYVSYSISDAGDFFKRLENNFRTSNKYYNREEKFRKMASETRTDVKVLLQSVLVNEIVLAITTISPETGGKSGIIVIPSRDRTAAEGQILQMMNKHAERNGQTLSDLSVTIDADKRLYAYKFPYPSLPGIWLGNPFNAVKAGYIGFWENNLVMAESVNEIASYFRRMSNGETLAKDIGYQKFMMGSDSRANINVFLDVARGFNLGKEVFPTSVFRRMDGKREHLRRFRYAGWQVINSKELFFNNLILSYNETADERIPSSGQPALGGKAAIKPHLVINHENRRQREIIVQDENNILYLISAEGSVKWSLDLQNRILSEIHQVDVLKNGRLQYLFNTKDRIYLVDRNGNNVAPFPVVLPSEATNGLAVFDYDRTRDYRIFVAAKDKRILLYDTKGKVVSGWKFGVTQSEVTTPVKHFRISGRDHIVFKDDNNLYIHDRQGAVRVRHTVKFESSGNPLVGEMTGKPKIVFTDNKGMVHYFYFDGKHETKDVGRYSAKHLFTAGDLDGNGVVDFVFADGDQLTVIDETGKRLFSERIRQGISHLPELVTLDGKTLQVGIVSEGSNRLFLFNYDGSQHKSFPVTSGSPFSVGKLNESGNAISLVAVDAEGRIFTLPLN
jgi:hypothetical protein